jgi:hypothetical protein
MWRLVRVCQTGPCLTLVSLSYAQGQWGLPGVMSSEGGSPSPPGKGNGQGGGDEPGKAAPADKGKMLTEDPVVRKWLEEKTHETKEKVEENKTRESRRRWTLGICYLLAMGVCGIVLVALGSTLTHLAENCGTTATYVGAVFVTRGGGAIFGAISSAKLYEVFEGNKVITTTLIILAGVLVYMPFVNQVWELHCCFGLLGVCTAVTDTGCQIMTRFIHGQAAGPWLGANTVSFGISGAIVPLVAYATGSLYIQYCVLAMISLTVAVILFFVGNAKIVKPVRVGGPDKGPNTAWYDCSCDWREFKTEMIVACMVFWLIGGKVTGARL